MCVMVGVCITWRLQFDLMPGSKGTMRWRSVAVGEEAHCAVSPP